MKISWMRHFTLIIALVLLAACGGKHTDGAGASEDPMLTSSPTLKSITDEIHKSPKDAALYFERGRQLHKLRYDSLALKDFKYAVSLDSSKSEYYSAIGDLLFENKDINGSLEWIQLAIRKNPEDRKAHLKIAKLFLYTGDHARAFAEINIVLRKNVYDPEAYFLKAMLYKDLKDTARAISNLQTAIQVSPEHRDAVVELGLLYSAKNDSIALRYLNNAFVMDSTDVFPIYAKGVYFQERGDNERAKAEYRRCILADRHFTDAYFNMGYILLQQDSTAKAWRQFDMAIKTDPTNTTAYFNRGLCSEIMDSLSNAVADYRTAARMDTGYAAPRKALQRLKQKM
ncbi:tetratricopeptide repeat protein [Nemorincola caseinilytica]